MLVTKLKPLDEIFSLVQKKTVLICCEGCRDVHSPDDRAIATLRGLLFSRTDLSFVVTSYVCYREHLELLIQNNASIIDDADVILVLSCGAGVQTIADFVSCPVYSICDTISLPGYQGLTPSEFNCIGCESCHLNKTASICPVTSCVKGLVNGACGGAKNGMCEVDVSIECGWVRIFERVESRK
ncbi:MAG: methylenetetrahydrofolate reductase C-terminal domain-containing protein [Oscillospiraceae bacterium]|jgi:electron transport complex protein RnfC|nr:methylenetetrahydrofolate reductase C-terminal domain-containing protein [Oscillospiraceae bacterium]